MKGPELAVELTRTLGARVIVLVTHGAMNFWNDVAERYNPIAWREFRGCLVDGGDGSGDGDSDGAALQSFLWGDGDTVDGVDEDGGRNACGKIIVVQATDEWNNWTKLGDPVLHIQLRDWADILLIAPLSAHTLAKLSNGLCDDTLTCVARAWDFSSSVVSVGDDGDDETNRQRQKGKHTTKPFVLAPAMNTAMWKHPLTGSQLDIIKGFGIGGGDGGSSSSGRGSRNDTRNHSEQSLGINKCDDGSCPVKIVQPQVKTLACGEIGTGAMANVVDIVAVVSLCLGI